MGKYGNVINLFGKTRNVLLSTGKTSVLQTRPLKNLSMEGLKFAPKSIGDTCNFKSVDSSLSPAFLDDLMKIDDTDELLFANKVAKKMLYAMGYSRADKISLGMWCNEARLSAEIDCLNAHITVPNLKRISKQEFIALIRHELEHLDQDAKLYKKLGPEEYFQYVKKKHGYSDEAFAELDQDFWNIFSRDANIHNVKVDKNPLSYTGLSKVKEGASADDCWEALRNSHLYASHSDEVAAYGKQKQVLKALGVCDITAADRLGDPLGNIIRYLDNLNISNEKKLQIFNDLSYAASIFSISPKAKLLLENFDNIINGRVISDNVQVAWNEISEIPMNDKLFFDAFKTVENWLSKGCYSVDDILAKGLV